MPSSSYDLIVIGGDLASLVCATLCARRGMRTLVLGDDRPARYQLGPHKLPVEPATWPTLPAAGGERVLKELHAELALRRKLREPKLAAQLVAPDIRIDLGTDRLGSELSRELPAAAKACLAAWDASTEIARQIDPLVSGEHAFPSVAFRERREVGRIVEKLDVDAAAWWDPIQTGEGTKLWRHLAAIALRHPAPPPAAIARAVDVWRDGPVSLRGDGDAIRELLIEKLSTAGGELRAGAVSELHVSWGKVSSVILASGDELGASQVVSSKPPGELAELLGKKAPKRLAELAETIEQIGYRYTLNVVLDQAGLPEHMAQTVAVIDPEGDPTADTAFSIHVGDTDDTGRVVATIAAVLPTSGPVEPTKLVPRTSAMRAKLWNRLGEVMPFFERHLVLAHSPFEATAPHVPGGRGSYDVPRSLPLSMAPVWAGTSDAMRDQTAGLGALPYLTGLKNLTLTGDQILPALGIEGALVAGWGSAKVACAIAGKKKDYLRDEVVGAAS